jgi:hypothetical protein
MLRGQTIFNHPRHLHLPSPRLILANRNDNRLAGLMTDTTWTVIPNCVTAILFAVSRNTTLFIPPAWSPAETCDLYDQFDRVMEEGRFHPSDFVPESDQSSVLTKFRKVRGSHAIGSVLQIPLPPSMIASLLHMLLTS